MDASTPALTFRLAQSGDFDAVVKLSEGISDGHDYLPLTFHKWLQRDDLAVLLAYQSGDELVGLQACFVVDEGRTLIRRAERILVELRGQGLVRQLREFARKYVREHYPSLQRERFTTRHVASSLDKKRILEYGILSYHVEKKSYGQAEISKTNSVEIEICSKEYFSDVVLSGAVRAQLFPDNIIVVNWCPFEPTRSNIDHMLQEADEMFAEKCDDDALPRSFSSGASSPTVKFVEWHAIFYSKDPVLFEAHLLQLKRACEVIDGDFIFLSSQDKSLTPSARKVMEEKLQLKVNDWPLEKTINFYEKDASK